MSFRLEGKFPALAAAAAPLIFFVHLLGGWRVLFWGLPVLQFVPWRTMVNQSLLAGGLPLWTPLLGMGAPLLANHQSAVFYPPNWLSLVMPPEIAISVLAALHLSAGGVGMATVARRFGAGQFGSTVAGVTFALCGYLAGRLWFISINNAVAYLPWVALAAIRLCASAPQRKFKAAIDLAALTALQLLAGHAQSAFYTLLISTACVLWWAHRSRGNWRDATRETLWFAFAVTVAALLAAAQLIPTTELLLQSPRAAAADYEFAVTYSFWPWRFISLFAPDFFGNPADGNYWGYGAYWEDHAYLSLLPLIFTAFAVWRSLRTPTTDQDRQFRSATFFLTSMATASVILAMGNNTPIFLFFYRFVPGFDLFQAPSRMMIGYTFAVCLLAGLGAESWLPSDRKRYWARLGIAASLALFALGVTGSVILKSSRTNTFGIALAAMAVVMLATFVLILAQPAAPRLWYGAVVMVIAIDLGIGAVRLNPTTSPSLYRRQPAHPIGLVDGRVYLFSADEYQIKFGRLFSFKSFHMMDEQSLVESYLPNLSALHGVASANNFDPLLSERYVRYIEMMEKYPSLMRLANVQAVVRRDLTIDTDMAGGVAIRPVYSATTVGTADEALSAITGGAFDPETMVVLESTQPAAPHPVIVDRQSQTIVDLMMDRDGYVVLSNVYYPGWRATVDGEPRPLFRANYLFMAVAVEAGEHRVEFEYAPPAVSMGLAVSLLALAVALAARFRHNHAPDC